MSLSHKRYLQYLPHALKIFGIAILCLVGVAFVAIIALSIGRYHIPIAEVCATLLGNGSEEQENIIFSFRLPRVILALVAGMGLSVSGCAFQSIFRNPLATPDILGVTSGASFGAVLALLLGLGTVFVGLFGLVFGLCALALVWGIAYDRNTPYSTITMILSGIIISALFQSLISLVKYVSDPQDTLPTITYWLLGSLESSFDMPYFAGVAGICAGSLVVYALSWKLNLLALSDDEARTLGMPLWRLRAVLIFACTLVVACGVSLCGIIGWVGLLVPHIARLLVGSETSKLVPLSAVLGAIFVCALDTISRSISSEQIPISILTALLGAPFFIYTLEKQRDATMSFLCVQNLCFTRGGRKILHNVDFSLERGEVLSILGSNGAGKTTLLKCLLGLTHATSGARLLESKPIESYGKHIWRKISYVPQAKGNILSLRVLDMVALGLNPMMAFKPNASDYTKANDALARLGVEYLAQKSCCDISGGELQMVLFARALVSEPEILVLDEPESNLDFKNQKIILDLLHSLNKQGCTIIINTHFPAHAIFLSHKALLLKKLENIKKSSDAPCVSGVSNESSAKVADSGADLPISLDSNAFFGDAKDILTQENLSALYGVPLHFSALARDRFADKSGFVVSV